MENELIQRYEAGATALRDALAGLSREELLAFPIPGTWSIQQIAIHLADTETVFAARMKWVIAEDEPPLQAMDENRWTVGLAYEQQSAADAAELVRLTRRQMVSVLRGLPESALGRAGTHTVAGRKTLKELIEKAVDHQDHHLRFLFEKRKKLGK
ncbi:MAG TPA: DinB family protein [Tepidisphaeraceae bacterium]|nr:DinB family protein [Tepidisphaeraceae bacterium]